MKYKIKIKYYNIDFSQDHIILIEYFSQIFMDRMSELNS